MREATRQAPAVLVTGGNSGIGLQCVRTLAAAGRRVLLASRDLKASQRACAAIAASTPGAGVEALRLDLSSTDSVRALVAELQQRDVALDALLCNAGVQFPHHLPHYAASGLEMTMAVNHVGHFLLVNLLLDRLLASRPARIVVTTSVVHDPSRTTFTMKPRIDDLAALAATGGTRPGAFRGFRVYANSKLCNVWFAWELARRLEAAGLSSSSAPVGIAAFDPGIVPGSGITRDYPAPIRAAWEHLLPALARALNPVQPAIATAEQAGRALAMLATDPQSGAHGARYYTAGTRWTETRSSRDSYDAGRAQQLWEASIDWSGLKRGESPLHC